MLKKDILDMASLSVEEIELILDTAAGMKAISERPIKKVPALRGKTVVLLFHEPSFHTRMSFDVAAKRLSADTIHVSASAGSAAREEALRDIVKSLESMKSDAIVLRHSSAGAPETLSKLVKIPIINAGDGMHAHPTQSLLDLMTVREKKGSIKGLRVAIIGDIAHSSEARSDCIGFAKMGAEVVLAAPQTMIPMGIESLGAEVARNTDEAVADADVIMVLPIRRQSRTGLFFPTEREYYRFYGLSLDRMAKAGEGVLVMHPGPVNRGVEISPDVVDGPHSTIRDQTANGVAVRMAALALVIGGEAGRRFGTTSSAVS